MKFYSGFSLKNEEYLFERFISFSDYTICGFSYGAIKAFQNVKEKLELSQRVDKLQLFSPVFFQTKEQQFKRLQLKAYKKDKKNYLQKFIGSCFIPYSKKIIEYRNTNIDELEELLNYDWNIEELKFLEKKGVKIEVYLGGEDKIIDVKSAREFFLEIATVTYIKDANHFLQVN